MIPLQARLLVSAVLAGGALSMAFVGGWTVNGWRLTAQLVEAAQAEKTQAQAAEQLRQERDALAAEKTLAESRAQQARARVITREVVKYVQADAPRCDLAAEWVRIHDAAAGVQDTGTAAAFDGAATVDAATHDDRRALVVITENYDTCLAELARLRGLQEWVRVQNGR